MEMRRFGKTGIEVSVLGFGGAEIGYEGAAASDVERILGTALDSGINVIDTAECYMNSEDLIGKAVSHRRSEYYLFTKCGHPEGLGTENWSASSILWSIERSLRRLRTEALDLVLLHSCEEEELRKGEVVDALQEARRREYTRFIGYSGDAPAALYAIGTGAFDVLETSVNIADQEAIERVLPMAKEKDMGVIVKRPVANAAWKTGSRPVNAYHHEYWERLQKLQYPFLKGPVSEAVGIALRFTLSRPGVHTAIVGTSNPARCAENVKLLEAAEGDEHHFAAIREIWKQKAPESWTGQT